MIKAFAMKSHRVADSSCQRSHSFISFSNDNYGQNDEHGRYISVGKSEFTNFKDQYLFQMSMIHMIVDWTRHYSKRREKKSGSFI